MRTYNRLQPQQKLSVNQVKDLCRLCMNVDSSMCDIFMGSEGNQATSLPSKILKCLSIEVKDNGFPTKLCASCLKSVNTFAEFWDQCHATNKKLQHLIDNNALPGLSEVFLQSSPSYSGYDELYKSPEHPYVNSQDNEEPSIVESPVYIPCISPDSSKSTLLLECSKSIPHVSSSDFRELSGEISGSDPLEVNLFETRNSTSAAADSLSNFQVEEVTDINESSDSVEVQVSMNGNSYIVKVLDQPREKNTVTASKEGTDIAGKCSQNNETLPVSQDKVSHQCPNCQESFENASDLKTHVKTHKDVKGFSCKFCSKWFSILSGLVRHERVHSGERPYKCVQCSKSFSQKEVLRRHVLTHSGNKPYKCDSCEKSYTQKEALRMHIKNNHVPKKYVEIVQYKCSLCEKSFCHLSGLSRHQQSHAGRKYPCKICDRVFTDQSCLRRHNQRVHSSSNSETSVKDSTSNAVKQGEVV